MYTVDDIVQPQKPWSFWLIPVDVFRLGFTLLFEPLDDGLHLSRRLQGLCLMVLGAPLALAGVLLLPLPVFVLFCVSALWMFYAGETAQFSSEGVVVSSRRRGCIARLNWLDIACARHSRTPPAGLWEIVLKSGDALPLPMVQGNALIAACRAAGVPVRREGEKSGEISKVQA